MKQIKPFLLLCIVVLMSGVAHAQNKTAIIRIDDKTTHQKITGFGGFVNSPQFGYNHMSTAEIRKLWGKDSQMGYNIMRIFISDSESAWSQAVTTAKLAKSLGLILFASPWSMPAEWKTNNSTAGKTEDGTIGYLKEENYADYAAFLNRFVTLMRNNGVELDAISIQNEPDFDVSYSGCHWTPAQMAKFLREHGSSINCKLMAPETVALSNERYINELLADDVIDKFDIYAGHQYGGVGEAHKKLRDKGKEIWQSEFLINWNEIESNTRDFDWSKDAFNFAKAINTCMLADVNAWVHYASKRYYAMLGDGQRGTRSGVITKRGYILSHYAKYVTGTTRIENLWAGDYGNLNGSAYLSVTGDSVIVVAINESQGTYTLTVDLPFNTLTGNSLVTTETLNMSETAINLTHETYRPKVTISPSSVSTFIFTKSRDRAESLMTGQAIYLDMLDDQTVTNSSFGTDYLLSGKTASFMNEKPLISSNTTSRRGYIKFNKQYNSLVFRVESLSSTMNYNSANTTLYYINGNGIARSHNYGTIDFDKRENFDWVLDISRNVLTEGCTGILAITNGNFTSELTFAFEAVYLTTGSEKMYKFGGIYSKDDSDLLDCLDDMAYTSIDFTETTGITSDLDWNAMAVNKNCIYYVKDDVINTNANIIAGTVCDKLRLTDEGGNFYAPTDFTATNASYQCDLSGYRMLVLPFESSIPAGTKVYQLEIEPTQVVGTSVTGDKIPANTPVLVKGTGLTVFEGSGDVSSPNDLNVNNVCGVYITMKVPTNCYYLSATDGKYAFHKAVKDEEPTIASFEAYLDPATAMTVSTLPLILDGESSVGAITDMPHVLAEEYYTPAGQRVYPERDKLKGIYILKCLMSDETVVSKKIYIP